MLNVLRSIFGKDTAESDGRLQAGQLPEELIVMDSKFPVATHIKAHLGFPHLDWDAVNTWISGIEGDQAQAAAWTKAEEAWLLYLRESLGGNYRLRLSDSAALLSSLDGSLAKATLDYIGKTQNRVMKVLDGLAQSSPWGRDILIVFDDQDRYYEYVSHFYSDDGEYALSGGMFISQGCAHFVTVKADMQTVEPVIAHEMTHASLSHLPIPLWLNEGLAVNTEQRLAGRRSALYTPSEMHEKHLNFWGREEIQEFWSGKSFARTDDGNMLSYDLARILVESFSRDWESFKNFALSAHWKDGGAAAAREHLGRNLGASVAALFDIESAEDFEPELADEAQKEPMSPFSS